MNYYYFYHEFNQHFFVYVFFNSNLRLYLKKFKNSKIITFTKIIKTNNILRKSELFFDKELYFTLNTKYQSNKNIHIIFYVI